MDAIVGSRVRRVLADVLGVDGERIRSETSLTDDLAADSLDMVELCVALEETFGVSLPRGLPGWVRTCGQLATFVESARPLPPPMMVVTVAPAGDGTPTELVRTVRLTPYDVDAVVEDAATYPPGTRVDVAVDGTDAATLAALTARFGRLVDRGLAVNVRGPGEVGVRPHAA
jgi:acyl carrier protein